MYQWCGFKSRRGKNKNLTALKSNSNTVWFNFQTYIYICVYIRLKINQSVLELDFRAVKFLFFPRREILKKSTYLVKVPFFSLIPFHIKKTPNHPPPKNFPILIKFDTAHIFIPPAIQLEGGI